MGNAYEDIIVDKHLMYLFFFMSMAGNSRNDKYAYSWLIYIHIIRFIFKYLQKKVSTKATARSTDSLRRHCFTYVEIVHPTSFYHFRY